jgi:hypothetical protein
MAKRPLKVVGHVCIGPGEGKRYLKEVLEDKSKFCDVIIAVGDGPIDTGTKRIARSFPKVKYYQIEESLFGTKQYVLKQTAQQLAVKENPDWILSFDADEVFEKAMTPEAFRELLQGEDLAWQTHFVHLYGDRHHHRCDKFWHLQKVQLYHYNPKWSSQFKKQAMHCGSVPIEYQRYFSVFPFLVEHLGYLDPKDINRKIERYEKYDPNGDYTAKGYYDSMLEEPTVCLYEPDKLRPPMSHGRWVEWSPEKREKMYLFGKNDGKEEKTYLVKNRSGRRVQVPESLLGIAKSQGAEVIQLLESPRTYSQRAEIETAPIVEYPERPGVFICPICHKEFISPGRLRMHSLQAHGQGYGFYQKGKRVKNKNKPIKNED